MTEIVEPDDFDPIQEFIDHLSSIESALADQPIKKEGALSPWDEVKRGKLVAEVEVAYKYYMDPSNPEGSFEERREKVNGIIERIFRDFIKERAREYRSVRHTYRGEDWNKPGGSSWKTLQCQPGFVFVRESLRRTTNGDWKEGPKWEAGDTKMSWKTGGHRRSETFAQLDAVYANIDDRVVEELGSARAILHDRGYPTELPR